MNRIILILLLLFIFLQFSPYCRARVQEINEVRELEMKSQLQKARHKLDAILVKDSQNAEVLIESASLYLKMGQKMLALIEFEKARRLKPADPTICMSLSKLHLENYSPDLALTMARNAVSLNPNNAKGQETLILALMANLFYAEANSRLNHLLKTHPQDPDVLHLAFLVNKNNGKFCPAMEFLKQAIDKKPTERTWLLELAELYEQSKNYLKSREIIEEFMSFEPDSVEGLKALAWLLEHRLHDYGQAEAVYTKLLAVDPLNSAAQAGLNRLSVKQNDVSAKFKRSLQSFYNQMLMWFSKPPKQTRL